MGTRECSAGRSQTKLALEQFLHDLERTCEGSSENDCTHIVFEQLRTENAFLTRRLFWPSGRSTDSTSTSRTKAESKG